MDKRIVAAGGLEATEGTYFMDDRVESGSASFPARSIERFVRNPEKTHASSDNHILRGSPSKNPSQHCMTIL